MSFHEDDLYVIVLSKYRISILVGMIWSECEEKGMYWYMYGDQVS